MGSLHAAQSLVPPRRASPGKSRVEYVWALLSGWLNLQPICSQQSFESFDNLLISEYFNLRFPALCATARNLDPRHRAEDRVAPGNGGKAHGFGPLLRTLLPDIQISR